MCGTDDPRDKKLLGMVHFGVCTLHSQFHTTPYVSKYCENKIEHET